MAKLLGNVDITGLSDSVRIINPEIDTNKIEKATSGNALSDIAFETARKYVTKLEALDRENEISEMQIQADNSISEYESTWAGKDKYSDENYSEYIKGFNEVQQKNNGLIRGKKFLTSDDVEDWKRKVKGTTEKINVTQEGMKNQYQIQRSLDRANINITALQQKAVLTDDEETYKSYLNSMTSLMGSYRVSMSEEQVEQMKIKSISDIETQRTRRQAEDIINGRGSDRQKLSQLKNLDNALKSDEFYTQEADKMAKDGYISKEYAEAYATQLKSSARSSMIGTNSILNQYEEKIRNDNYILERDKKMFEQQTKNQYNSDKYSAITSISSGNDLKAMEILTGNYYSSSDIINNGELLNEFYGGKEVVEDNNYIAVSFSTTDINNLKNRNRVDFEEKIPRDQTVDSIMGTLNSYEGVEKENARKQLIATGVMSELEYNVYENNIANGNKIVNYASIGSKVNGINKLNGFVGVKSNFVKGDFMEKINNLPFGKREQITEAITGMIASGEFGVGINPGKGITAVEFKNAYTNPSYNFKENVDYIVDVITNTPSIKYKENKIKVKEVENYLDVKYGGKVKTTRNKTSETGEEPNIRYLYSYDDL